LAELRGSSRPWSAVAGGIAVTVRLTPKGGHDAIEGIEQRADRQCVLKARVRAAASEGEANDALLKLLARALAIPSRNVTLVSGATSRIKRLTIAGDGPTLVAALEKIAGVR
jgi:uncharacterized protein YggU (UPF0235/DUF167 family)